MTQGTITVRADRLIVQAERRQLDAGDRVRQPGLVPPEARRRRRVLRGLRAAHRVRRREATCSSCFDRALLKRGQDEIRSNYISYNAKTELFKAEGRPDTPAAAANDTGPGARVRGMFQPREGADAGRQGAGDKARAEGRRASRGAAAAAAASRGRAGVASEPARRRRTCASATSRAPSCTTSRSTSRAARSSACSAPTARARRRAST